MSGNSRALRSTEGSIFRVVANATALSRIVDSALRPISKTGREDWDNVMD
jgi:hypothetical protein